MDLKLHFWFAFSVSNIFWTTTVYIIKIIWPAVLSRFISFHCKLTRRRRSIQLSLLLQLCDSVALLVLILYTCEEKTIYLVIYIMKSKHLPNSSLINGVMIKTYKITILFYFSLTCLWCDLGSCIFLTSKKC